MQLELNDTAALPEAAQKLLAFFGDRRVVAFRGQMGAGKTTLIKAICEELGVQDNTSSPSFALVNEYRTSAGPIYHFDFYRLKKAAEAFDIGFEEYVSSGHWCLIEWPEMIDELLPGDAVQVMILLEGEKRVLSVT